MLLEIGEPARADSYIEARLGARAGLSKHERGNPRVRVPGFGHRVYRVDDARARVLRGMAKSMAAATGRESSSRWPSVSTTRCRARTTLPVNVDFFSAVVYDALGIRRISARRSSRSDASRAGARTRWSSTPTIG